MEMYFKPTETENNLLLSLNINENFFIKISKEGEGVFLVKSQNGFQKNVVANTINEAIQAVTNNDDLQQLFSKTEIEKLYSELNSPFDYIGFTNQIHDLLNELTFKDYK